jgi:hypothetical protein
VLAYLRANHGAWRRSGTFAAAGGKADVSIRVYGLASRKIGNFGAIQRRVSCLLAQAKGPLMQVVLAILIPLAVLAACSQGGDVTGATSQCKASLPYDEKNFDQCIAACIKCENGVTTTCATSCRLKGAK